MAEEHEIEPLAPGGDSEHGGEGDEKGDEDKQPGEEEEEIRKPRVGMRPQQPTRRESPPARGSISVHSGKAAAIAAELLAAASLASYWKVRSENASSCVAIN